MDIKLVRDLIALMNENDLAEVEIEQGGQKVRLCKRGPPPAATHTLMPMGMMAAPTAAPAAPAAAGPAGNGTAATALPPGTVPIKSPIVGTFYRAPAPDQSPFVDKGDRVTKDTVVCIIEAMKVMNEIKADVTGTVEAVLLESGEPVEFGQPLFTVRVA